MRGNARGSCPTLVTCTPLKSTLRMPLLVRPDQGSVKRIAASRVNARSFNSSPRSSPPCVWQVPDGHVQPVRTVRTRGTIPSKVPGGRRRKLMGRSEGSVDTASFGIWT